MVDGSLAKASDSFSWLWLGTWRRRLLGEFGILSGSERKNTANLITPNGSTNVTMAQTAPVTLASGTKVVFSVWLKMASGSVVGFPLYIIGNSSGVIGSSFPTVTTTWQRFSVSGTMGGSDTTAAIQIGVGGPGPISTSFYVWGPQLETGTVETQYIPTAAYSVISTRPALYPPRRTDPGAAAR